MRTTIDIDDDLLAAAMRETGKKSRKAAVEEAVREYVNARRRQGLISMIGKGHIDMTLEDLWKLRGCDKAREATAELQRRGRRAG